MAAPTRAFNTFTERSAMSRPPCQTHDPPVPMIYETTSLLRLVWGGEGLMDESHATSRGDGLGWWGRRRREPGGRPEPSGPPLRQPRRRPILKCRRKPSAAGSRRSIGSASSSRRTRASGLASWGRCCVEKACIARTWRIGRRQRAQGALRDMRGRRRGPTPRPIDPRVKQLEAENRRLERKLQRAETIIALQKKVAEILEIPLKPLDTDETD